MHLRHNRRRQRQNNNCDTIRTIFVVKEEGKIDTNLKSLDGVGSQLSEWSTRYDIMEVYLLTFWLIHERHSGFDWRVPNYRRFTSSNCCILAGKDKRMVS